MAVTVTWPFVADPLSETLKIDGADAAALARNIKTYAGDIKGVKSGEASAGVSTGFPGFQIGATCTMASSAAANALKDLSTTLDAIGNNTITVLARFWHVDEIQAQEFDRIGDAPHR